MKTILCFLIVIALLPMPSSPVWAGPGHDHGDETPAATGAASPRFEAHSDLFEVVGVMDGDLLIITIDRYDSNAPVLQAKLELESGATNLVAKFNPATADYTVPSAAFKNHGTYPIALTVTAGQETDLLAGELIIPDADGHSGAHTHPLPWRMIAGVSATAVLLLLAGLYVWRRRARAIKPASSAWSTK
jgi:membrane fusion protein, heavy metal efflux system